VVLIQILLPRTTGDGTVSDRAFSETRRELIGLYEGITAYLRSPASGAWTDPDGRVEYDEMVMVEILANSFDRHWWRSYAGTLAHRFQQKEIHIRALPAELL